MVFMRPRKPSWRLSGILVVALLIAGCFGDPGQNDDDEVENETARWTVSEWKAALSQSVYDDVESSLHYLSAEDGTQLALTLHRPAGLPPDARIPTLLQLTPYQPLDTNLYTPVTGFTPTPGPFGASPGASWASFVARGAAYVEADARGTGASEGCLDFGGSLDRSDARVFMDWIRAQDWSDGRIVTDGVSHPGMGSVVAHSAEAGLTAALAHAPVVSYYQDEWLQGAKFEDQLNIFYQAIELQPPPWLDPQSLAAQAALCTGETTLQYAPVDGRFTELWADRDLSRHVHPETESPILLTHGFLDQNVHPDHSQLYWDALPEDFPKHMILGWWYHSWPNMENHPGASDEGMASFFDIRHRWLDATLFGIDNGLWSEPRVLVQDSRLDWHESHHWPIDGSMTVTLHADASGDLRTSAAAGSVSFLDAAGARRGSWEDAHVAFRSPPLEQAMLVNGAPSLDLVAASSETETKWVAYLLDEAPDGSWKRITHGYADSRTHAGESAWDPMQPGESYAWRLHLMPTAVVVEAGHRVTLVIASQDSRNGPEVPCWDTPQGGCHSPSGIVPAATVGRAENTVHTGPDATRVTFAWVDPDATRKPPA